MKVRILRNYGNYKKGDVVEATGNTKQFLFENGIACVAPKSKEDDCNEDCEECEDCKGKNKKKEQVKKPSAKTQPKKKTVKKKVAKK